jgi:hypothetical protein
MKNELQQEHSISLEPTLDEAVAELLALRADLFSLPAEAFERRLELQTRLTEVRAVVAELRTQTPTEHTALRNHLNRLETEIGRRKHNRISHLAAGQTGMGGGLDPEFVHALNREIDKGQGVADLQAEIARIRALLSND